MNNFFPMRILEFLSNFFFINIFYLVKNFSFINNFAFMNNESFVNTFAFMNIPKKSSAPECILTPLLSPQPLSCSLDDVTHLETLRTSEQEAKRKIFFNFSLL